MLKAHISVHKVLFSATWNRSPSCFYQSLSIGGPLLASRPNSQWEDIFSYRRTGYVCPQRGTKVVFVNPTPATPVFFMLCLVWRKTHCLWPILSSCGELSLVPSSLPSVTNVFYPENSFILCRVLKGKKKLVMLIS